MDTNKSKRLSQKKRHMAAIFGCILFVTITAASFFYVVENQVHRCSGEGCSICHEMQLCDGNVRTCLAGSMSFFCCSLFVSDATVIIHKWMRNNKDKTLVSLKVKLSD